MALMIGSGRRSGNYDRFLFLVTNSPYIQALRWSLPLGWCFKLLLPIPGALHPLGAESKLGRLN